MSHINLFLLGLPLVECGGVPLVLDSRKTLALLAYLAVSADSCRRDTLVNLLWPESGQ